ncbi:MAG: diguanylate cyclase [Candidatus Thiodiazotropha sp. (ex Dulcina madagascariensis)]|nr:diguanylate cyclase [Candidatus Thiodiazotropha sp. (ex Dulcina madagascariensis)]
MKLLISDDDLTSRVMLQALTTQWGFEPVLAEDGEQAWAILQGDNPPRLLLLDWEMPGMSGPDVCKKVQEMDLDDPPFIILLTARNEKADIVAGLDAGANDYVSKPFDSAELRARLQVGKRMIDLQSELLQAHHQLKTQAAHDTLTELLNRGAVMSVLKHELVRSQREGSPLCIGLCDVDHFKNINDNYGHLVGDAVLKELAKRFNKVLRPYDQVGRYGGEEFLIITNTIDINCMSPFERIRECVADTPFQHEGLSIPVTISIGIVQFTPTSSNSDINGLLNLADKALYEAKANGRNSSILA